MPEKPISKFDQYALVTYLAGKRSRQVGKKALQKLVHLVQELGDVDAGYRFSFYTYGPYSSDLTADLDAVAALGGIRISYDSADNSFAIEIAQGEDWVLAQGGAFIARNSGRIDEIVKQFGERLAKDLELVSTIVYLRRHERRLFDNDGDVVARVKALKPKYSESQIMGALDEVRSFASAPN
ncbi:MAG: hypothetical protein ACREHE_14395 [Rhizomicrobium sp.]